MGSSLTSLSGKIDLEGNLASLAGPITSHEDLAQVKIALVGSPGQGKTFVNTAAKLTLVHSFYPNWTLLVVFMTYIHSLTQEKRFVVVWKIITVIRCT